MCNNELKQSEIQFHKQIVEDVTGKEDNQGSNYKVKENNIEAEETIDKNKEIPNIPILCAR